MLPAPALCPRLLCDSPEKQHLSACFLHTSEPSLDYLSRWLETFTMQQKLHILSGDTFPKLDIFCHWFMPTNLKISSFSLVPDVAGSNVVIYTDRWTGVLMTNHIILNDIKINFGVSYWYNITCRVMMIRFLLHLNGFCFVLFCFVFSPDFHVNGVSFFKLTFWITKRMVLRISTRFGYTLQNFCI